MGTLVPGQQYSPAEIYQNDPEWLKQNNPALYSQFTKEVGQPTAGLQQTQTSTAAQAASIPGTQARSQVESATVLPQIQKVGAEATITQQEADKQKAYNETQAMFTAPGVQGKDGKVSPQTYNAALEKASKYMTSDEFNARFQEPFTNPNNVFYNTPSGITVRSTLPQVANIVKSYYGLTKNGPNWEALTHLPLVGDYLKKTQLPDEIAHDAALRGTSAEILKAAGAGAGSTIRGNLAELSQVTGMLPMASDAKETANKKMDKLDNFLQKTYGTSLKDWLAQ